MADILLTILINSKFGPFVLQGLLKDAKSLSAKFRCVCAHS